MNLKVDAGKDLHLTYALRLAIIKPLSALLNGLVVYLFRHYIINFLWYIIIPFLARATAWTIVIQLRYPLIAKGTAATIFKAATAFRIQGHISLVLYYFPTVICSTLHAHHLLLSEKNLSDASTGNDSLFTFIMSNAFSYLL